MMLYLLRYLGVSYTLEGIFASEEHCKEAIEYICGRPLSRHIKEDFRIERLPLGKLKYHKKVIE
nr:MAG: hypothetical protein [uncultured archaeon]